MIISKMNVKQECKPGLYRSLYKVEWTKGNAEFYMKLQTGRFTGCSTFIVNEDTYGH